MKQFFLLLSFLCVLVGCTANAGEQIIINRPNAEPTANINTPTPEPTNILAQVVASATPPPTPHIDTSHLPYPPPDIIHSRPQSNDPPQGYPMVDLETLPNWRDADILEQTIEKIKRGNKSIAEGTLVNLTNEHDLFDRVLILTIDVSRSWLGTEEEITIIHHRPDLYSLEDELAVGDQLLVILSENPHSKYTYVNSLWRLDEEGMYVSSHYIYPRYRFEPAHIYNLIEAHLNQG